MKHLLTYFVHLFNNPERWNKPLREFLENLPIGLVYWSCIGTTILLCLLFYLVISRKVSFAKFGVWFAMLSLNGTVAGILSVAILSDRLKFTIVNFRAVGGFPDGLTNEILRINFWDFTFSFTAQLILFSMILFLVLSILLKGLSSNARYVPFRWPN